MTENIGLKFDSGPSTTLTKADDLNKLAATVRYEDEKGISKGDTLDVLSAHTEEKMGTAEVVHTEMVDVKDALDVIDSYYALYGINTTEYLVSRLHDYYGGPMSLTTEVKVIILNPDMKPVKER